MTRDPVIAKWVKPQQTRSQDTLDRLCRSAERLLDEKLFEQMTVEEIARGADLSVGGFYARFRDKEALFAYLYERYESEFRDTAGVTFHPDRWRGIPLAQRVEAMARMSLRLLRSRPGFFRALALRSQTQFTPVVLEQSANRAELIIRVRDLLLECRDEMTHPDPELAVTIGFFQLLVAIQSRTLFPESPHASLVAMPDDVLLRELTRGFLAYVGTKTELQEETAASPSRKRGIS